MAEEATVKIDERGRVTIPQGTRIALGISGDEAWLRIKAETIDQNDVDGD
jgi:bifunctional DNA-binding transcriptional regulator/antitoxin component of YhaV-PrlF toxin-antitoxin module